MNIVLIGMPGSGKSTIGKKLAKKLNYEFVDVDDLIVRDTQMDLQSYIDRFGDEDFLRVEEEAVLDLDVQNCVIAPGGSIVYSQKAISHLKKNSVIIFLDLSVRTLESRITDPDKRGIVYLRKKPYEELFHERRVLCKKYSDITLDVDGLTVEQVVRRIGERLSSDAM
jgi:shikimate kinase